MILAILQARMGSTRLPGKVLMKILGKPMLELQIERILRAESIDKLVVATSTNYENNEIRDFCEKNNIECFRGSENDLLDRYYQCANQYKPSFIVRLTGDDPLACPEVIDDMIKIAKNGNFDAVTNTVIPTFPEGLDATVMSFETLKKAWSSAKKEYQREHVAPYIFDNEDKFSIYHFRQHNDLSTFRWTVDYMSDFLFIKKIYKELYTYNYDFSSEDVYLLLKQKPELLSINSQDKRESKL